MIKHVGLLEPPQVIETPVAVCPHCGKEYKTEAALKAHITREHSEEADTSEK